jgi:hypothetical protein
MKLVDIINANQIGAFIVLSSVAVKGEKRAERRRYIDAIDHEIKLFNDECKAILAASGLMDVPEDERKSDPRSIACNATIAEYLSTESKFNPTPLFTWDEFDAPTTREQEIALEAVGAVAPTKEPEKAKAPGAPRKKPTKGAHGGKR